MKLRDGRNPRRVLLLALTLTLALAACGEDDGDMGPGPVDREPAGPNPTYVAPADRIDPAAVTGWNYVQVRNLGRARVAPGAGLGLPTTTNARYVATTGDDAADGSMTTPWKTLQHAADNVGPDTTVYVSAGEYTGGLSIEGGGAENQWVVFTALDPANRPRLLGGMNRDAVVDIDASWVVFANFEVADHDRGSLSLDAIGIQVEPRSVDIDHVWILRNLVNHIGPPNVPGTSCYYNAHGIIAQSEDLRIANLILDGNELYSLYVGNSECLVVNGLVEQFWVTRNYVHDVENIAIDIIGYEKNDYETTSQGLIADNVVLDASNYWPYCTRGNCTYPAGDESSDGIYVDGGAELEIAYNVVGRTDLGIELQSENGQLIRDVQVHHNAVFNSNYVNWVLGPSENVTETDNQFFDAAAMGWPVLEACP